MASIMTREAYDAGYDDELRQVRKVREELSSDYKIVKMWDEDTKTWLIHRKSDDQQFLGFPWNPSRQFVELLDRGAGIAATALLNHLNLVNPIAQIPMESFQGNLEQAEWFSVWDFCDAGSLAEFMSSPPGVGGVPKQELTACGRVKRFLPESLVWHVTISMLRALAWLHEGYREEVCIDWEGDTPLRQIQGRRAETDERGSVGEDWMPVLHRNIRAENIFFQHPRGSETYGNCKLGNFSKAFVSGHVHNNSGGQVVCSEDGTVPLDKLRQHMAVQNIYTVKKNERPYFKGTELYHLGEVLYQMMTRKTIPDREECPICQGQHHNPQDTTVAQGRCPLGKHFFLGEELGIAQDLTPVDTPLEYTLQLRQLVYDMLSQQYRGSGSKQVDGKNAIALLGQAWKGYDEWKENDEDGKLYRDEWDDMVLRYKNWVNKEEANMESAKRQSGRDAVDVLDV